MTGDSPAAVAAAYFDAWLYKDIEQVRSLLHDDVDFVGALGATHGLDDTLAGLRGMFAMTDRIEVVKRWVDGPDVLTWFELRTATAGPWRLSTGVRSRPAGSRASESHSTRVHFWHECWASGGSTFTQGRSTPPATPRR